MDISTITHVTSDYIKNALEESAKASKTENRDFGSVFQSALGMVMRQMNCKTAQNRQKSSFL